MSLLLGVTWAAALLSLALAARSLRPSRAPSADVEAGAGAAAAVVTAPTRAAGAAAAADGGEDGAGPPLSPAGSAALGRRASLDAALEGIGGCMQGSY
jgi:hypothetical protein